LALLSGLQETHKDERTTKLFQSAGTIFFAQETSNLYYEAFEMIKNQKFTEAKEHLEQALLKEPGQVLVLTRLIQMELLLGQKEQASIHLKTAQANTSGSSDLKLFAAKLAIEKSLVDAEDENENELYRDFSAFKALLLENEVTLTFWAESLMRAHKTAEIEAFAQKMLKDHPQWTYALAWFRTNANPSLLLDEKLKAQIEKNLKDKNAFLAALETEMKRSDYFWVGYVNYDTLVALQKPTPTPAP
jgi:cellobiose-specific phosphotransferase system component IIA